MLTFSIAESGARTVSVEAMSDSKKLAIQIFSGNFYSAIDEAVREFKTNLYAA
jgi:hypothetical protein